MKDRSEQISTLERAIKKTKGAIATQKHVLIILEEKLEKQRWELSYQKMLGKFDYIDGFRQQVSDIIATQNQKEKPNE